MSASLATHDEFARPPVHIAQLQTRDLDRAQAQPRDQRHDREVADTDRAAAVAAVEQTLDVRGASWWAAAGWRDATHRPEARPSRAATL